MLRHPMDAFFTSHLLKVHLRQGHLDSAIACSPVDRQDAHVRQEIWPVFGKEGIERPENASTNKFYRGRDGEPHGKAEVSKCHLSPVLL